VKINSNTKFDNSDRDFFSIPKLVIYLNYILCFFNTFIVFFNKKKYQIFHAKLDDLSIKKRVKVGKINEYTPNWSSTYWGIIYYPLYKLFFKKYHKEYQNKEKKVSILGNDEKSDFSNNKYMYLEIWDPPFLALHFFCYYSPLQLIYISKAKQENWYKYAIQAIIISGMLHIIVDLLISLVTDKNIVNREVFKEYNEKFVYNKLCIPKFDKCVGTDMDLPEDDQLSFYNSNSINKSFHLRNRNPYSDYIYEPNRYSNRRYNDDIYYSNNYVNNQKSLRDSYRTGHEGYYNKNYPKSYHDYYYQDRDMINNESNISSDTIYSRNSYYYNSNDSFNRKRDQHSQFSRNDGNSHIIYSKYSPSKSIRNNYNYNNNRSFEKVIDESDNNIPQKFSGVDDNGEFIVTYSKNKKVNYDEKRNSKFITDININKSRNEPYNRGSSYYRGSSFNNAPSIHEPIYNKNRTFNKTQFHNKTLSTSSSNSATILNNNNNNSGSTDKKNLSFSDRSKFVIIDKNNMPSETSDEYEYNKDKISYNDTFNSIKKFQFIDKKDISSEKVTVENESNNNDDEYVCLLDALGD